MIASLTISIGCQGILSSFPLQAIAFLVAAIIAAVYTLGLLAVTGIGIFSAIVSVRPTPEIWWVC